MKNLKQDGSAKFYINKIYEQQISLSEVKPISLFFIKAKMRSN